VLQECECYTARVGSRVYVCVYVCGVKIIVQFRLRAERERGELFVPRARVFPDAIESRNTP
jgi:hypothetical protein